MVSFPELGPHPASSLRPASCPHPASFSHPASGPDVWSLSVEELDALDDLREEIVTVSHRLEADTQRLLGLIADFDTRRGWELSGHRGCAEWLAASTGIDIGAARERVRAARALAGLPLLREAMGRGELSFSKIRALTRIATPDNEDELLPLALSSSAAQLERIVRTWRSGSEEELDREERRHQSRELSLVPDLDGMIQLRGRLTPEAGALLMKAIEAASDAIYREEGAEALASEGERRRIAAQRRADALARLAERALEVGVGEERDTVRSGSQAERYQVILHVGAATLGEGAGEGGTDRSGEGGTEGSGAGGGEAPGPMAGSGNGSDLSEIEPGIRVSAETSKRICCDASVVRVTHGTDGSLLDFGRRTRTIPPALRRALEIRDRSCRFPGCSSRFCEAHHIRHWAVGGETSLSNTLLLCRHHHRLVHEGLWSLGLSDQGHPVFRSPRGELVASYGSEPIDRVPVAQRQLRGSPSSSP